MALEIERKFLVRGEFKEFATQSSRVVQGYLNSAPERTVRVRVSGDKAFITIKGLGTESGLSRYEWERSIPVEEAMELLEFCEPGIIDKVRYLIPFEGHMYEVDEFHGDNEGLILAEIELESEDAVFARPEWLGEEVTGDTRYYNSILLKNPYRNW